MWISDLSQETLDQLYSALEKGFTSDWKALMRKWFSTHPGTCYTEYDVALNESSKDLHPAKKLLDDLISKKIPLEELVDGLIAIGNKNAVSIITKGTWKSSSCFNTRYSGGRPPPYSTGWTPESKLSSFSCTQPRREQGETLKHPIQESVIRDEHPYEPGLEVPLSWEEAVVSKLFPCFSRSFFTS